MKILILTLAFLSLAFAIHVSAQGLVNNNGSVNNSGAVNNTNSNSSSGSVNLEDPLHLGKDKPIPELISRVINGVLGVVGSFALLMFIYGGFMWMLSAGNEKMIEKGKSTLIWAALGLVIIFMSYALVKFVIDTTTGG
jgi:hypothetical protein